MHAEAHAPLRCACSTTKSTRRAPRALFKQERAARSRRSVRPPEQPSGRAARRLRARRPNSGGAAARGRSSARATKTASSEVIQTQVQTTSVSVASCSKTILPPPPPPRRVPRALRRSVFFFCLPNYSILVFAQFLLFVGSSQSPKGAARFRAGRAAAVFDEAALIPAAERGEAARGAHAPSPDSDVRAGAISALLQLPSPSLSKRNAGASPNVGAAPRSQHSGRSSFRGGDGDGAARSGEKRYVRAGENAGDLQEGDDEYDDEYDSEFDGEENSGFISPTGLSSGTSTISPPLRKKNIASKKKTKKNGAARRRRRNASFGIDAVTTLSREALALRRNPTAAYINAELFKAQHGPGTGLAGGLGHKKRARVDLLQRNMPKTLRPLYASLVRWLAFCPRARVNTSARQRTPSLCVSNRSPPPSPTVCSCLVTIWLRSSTSIGRHC